MKNAGETRRLSVDLKFKSIAVSLVVVLYLATILVSANAAGMSVTLESPPNNTVTMNNQPDFRFIATHSSSPTLSCTLWLKLNTSGTPAAYGTNGSVVNGASTIIRPSSPVPNGQYQWWIDCSDGTASIISEKRTITVNVFRGDRSFAASYDGSTRYYWLDLPDHFDSSVPTPLVIFLHGYGQDRSMYRTYFPVFRQIFHQNGWMVACADCRKIGNYHTWYTAPSRSDITDVVNLLEQEFNINRNHIHVMGTSMGGSGTLKYAMFNPDIIASAFDVFGVTNFTEFHDWTTDSNLHDSIEVAYGGAPSAVSQVYMDESPLGNEIRFRHTPVFLIHGSADTVVPVSDSRNLNNTLTQAGYDVKYVEVPRVGHYATTLVEGREQEVYEWFRDHPLAANYSLHLKIGWTMVSFPVVPINRSFASVFNGVDYYEILTWGGTSYLAPSEVEAGRGYWALVLAEITVNITYGLPVEYYEKESPADWSMIGSVNGKSVNASSVFPGYYQLVTWSGTSYTTAATIEPGKGYWALVLSPTHIVVD